MHKDIYGVKARWISFSSEEEARAALASLQATGEKVQKHEEALEAEAAKKFEARVDELIESGAADRKTAIHWLDEAHNTDGDMEYLCYQLGLPYGYMSRAK